MYPIDESYANSFGLLFVSHTAQSTGNRLRFLKENKAERDNAGK